MTLQELIAAQKETIAALRKRIAGIDSMMAQGQEERNALVADLIHATGKLDGLRVALGLQQKETTYVPDANS